MVGGGVPVASPSSSSSSSSVSSSDEEDFGASGRGSFDKAGGWGSRRSQEGSDVWHSESEANWTLAGASVRNGKGDILQSQVLSEGAETGIGVGGEGGVASLSLSEQQQQQQTQRRPSVTFTDSSLLLTSPPPLAASRRLQREPLPPCSEREEADGEEGGVAAPQQQRDGPSLSGHALPPVEKLLASSGGVGGAVGSPLTSPLEGEEFRFLPPRSAEVFGECSWNALPLAVSTSQVRGKPPAGECQETCR